MTKKPYIQVQVRFGQSYHSQEVMKMTIDRTENPEWWGVFTDELKMAFLDEDMTSISIRRIKK